MKKKSVLERISQISAFLSKYIGLIIILLSVIAFFKPSGFAWATSYTSWFLGVILVGYCTTALACFWDWGMEKCWVLPMKRKRLSPLR